MYEIHGPEPLGYLVSDVLGYFSFFPKQHNDANLRYSQVSYRASSPLAHHTTPLQPAPKTCPRSQIESAQNLQKEEIQMEGVDLDQKHTKDTSVKAEAAIEATKAKSESGSMPHLTDSWWTSSDGNSLAEKSQPTPAEQHLKKLAVGEWIQNTQGVLHQSSGQQHPILMMDSHSAHKLQPVAGFFKVFAEK
ncbi:hypothetical protein B0H17DRAFT_1134439 [Mycena rosella]|uniref:Uncharacterized protein n=1 Tax=Mycena rosella TaxID=1033263 RepID=A0AAD7DFL4_MYCRO|nr:hypothetical protein B0H17DRAFT_1134439 [Mycena rosella]